jgi:hypothetical protein
LAEALTLNQSFSQGLHTFFDILASRKKMVFFHILSFLGHLFIISYVIQAKNLLKLLGFKKLLTMRSILCIWKTYRIGNIQELLDITCSCKYRLSNFQFSNQAAKWPHVYRKRISSFQHYFRSAIVSWLKILINLFTLKATGAEIYEFYSWFAPFFHNNILRFDVTMNDAFFL